jgi:CheY-like chemotaxis protein
MPDTKYSGQPDSQIFDEQHESPPTSLISRRLHDFFAEQGLPRHKHSSQLAVILGLSRSGAFRKFQDGAFSAADLQSLANHFQVDVGVLLSASAHDGEPGAASEVKPARIVIGNRPMACKITVGAELGPGEHCELVAALQGGDWLVQPYAAAGTGPRHRVLELVITPVQRQLPRLAVLEDSADLAANLKDAFEGAGFRVEAFASASELARQSLVAPFDAYVVDWWLNGKTSATVLHTIRKAQPTVPMILTTGAIANGNAVEDDIVRVAVELRIQVIEKPFRLALLISQVKQLLGETI